MHAKIIASVVVVLAGAGYLFFNSFDDTLQYAHVDKVMKQPDKWQGKKSIQVHGYVVPGTIHEQILDQRAHRTFEIEYCGQRLHVVHAGVKPDTFKEQAETVITGRLVSEAGGLTLEAVEGEAGIMAKCPSKYEGNREAPKCDAP